MNGQGLAFIIGIIALCIVPAIPALVSRNRKES